VTQAGSTSYGYDANGNMTSRGGSSISYTSYNLPSLINAGSETSALHYGAFRNRFKQVTAGASPETRIYVAGLMEKVTRGGVTEYRYQIGGPTGTVAIYTRRTDGSTPTYYLLRDHLGSPELASGLSAQPRDDCRQRNEHQQCSGHGGGACAGTGDQLHQGPGQCRRERDRRPAIGAPVTAQQAG
jgi:hypothetical protein